MSTCFFIGHRDAPDSLLPLLSAAIEERITEHNVDQFVVGHYGKFDSLSAQAVRAAKKKFPDILLFYLRPYHPADRPFTPAGFDGSLLQHLVCQTFGVEQGARTFCRHDHRGAGNVGQACPSRQSLFIPRDTRDRKSVV